MYQDALLRLSKALKRPSVGQEPESVAEDPKNEKLLTRKEAAKLFDIHLNTLDNLARQGHIERVKFPNRAVRYRPSDIERYIEDMKDRKGKRLSKYS